MREDGTVARQIRIHVLTHSTTDLLIATSDDLPGLMVAGRSHEQLQHDLPAAIKELLEANGRLVVSVDKIDVAETNFQPLSMIANARFKETMNVAG